MVTFDWKILRVDNYQTLTSDSGEVFYDVIYALQWQITGTDDTTQNTAWVNDSMGINIDLSGAYTPRNEITETQLIDWVKTNLGPEKIAELEAQVIQMLEAM